MTGSKTSAQEWKQALEIMLNTLLGDRLSDN